MEHLRITVAGTVYDVVVEKLNQQEYLPAATPTPAPVRASAPVAARPTATPVVKVASSAGDCTSPLAGIVQAVALKAGDPVKTGDVVVTLEAMKMYTAINAPADGTITDICVKVGDAVEEGQVLYTIG